MSELERRHARWVRAKAAWNERGDFTGPDFSDAAFIAATTELNEAEAALLALPSAPQEPPQGKHWGYVRSGLWPTDCQQLAFVRGAQWWELEGHGATMWGSDRNKAEDEAIRRYGEPSIPAPPSAPTGETR